MQLTVVGVDEQWCKDLGREARGALKLMGRHARVHVVCDPAETAQWHLHSRVGLLVNGKLVAEGFVPTAKEIAGMLKCQH
jgi:hypothetical protein